MLLLVGGYHVISIGSLLCIGVKSLKSVLIAHTFDLKECAISEKSIVQVEKVPMEKDNRLFRYLFLHEFTNLSIT